MTRFEDLIAWQKARSLNKAIFDLSQARSFAKYFSLKDQIRRSSLSVMSNIAEGFERGNANEYYHFLRIAKASCGEVRCQLYAALDANCLDESQFELLNQQAIEVSRIIGGLMKSVDTKRQK